MKQVRLLEEHFTYHDLGTNTYYEYTRDEFTLRYHIEDNVWEMESKTIDREIDFEDALHLLQIWRVI